MSEVQQALPVLQVNQVSMNYGARQILKSVSFGLQPGERVALTGPNGAGKSTLLKILTGCLKPRSGRVSIQGHPIQQRWARQQLAYSPQHLDFPAGLRVAEVMQFVHQLYQPARQDTQHLADLKTYFGIDELWQKRADRLSGGENKRVSLVLALGAGTPLVVLDEPASALDRQFQQALNQWLDAVPSWQTLLFVSHDAQDVLQYAQRVLQLVNGQLVRDARPEARQTLYGLRFQLNTALPDLSGILQAKRSGLCWELHTSDSDAVIRQLVQRQVPFRDLQIQPLSRGAEA